VAASHEPTFLLRATARAFWIASADVLSVGLWHPGLLAWRAEAAARSVLGGSGRQRRFEAALTARQTGQAGVSFVQGDTPWHVLRKIARWLRLGPQDTFVDVGAGHGLAAAVMALVTGAKGVAVEPVAAMREGALTGYQALRVPVTTAESLEQVDVAGCKAAFLGWTCVEAPARARMEEALRGLPSGARVATVTDAITGPCWQTLHSEPATLPWGRDRWFAAERR